MTPQSVLHDAAAIRAQVAAEGLLAPGRPVVVLLSGGQDSVCLLHLAIGLAGRGSVHAVHVDYGLRESSSADAALCRGLCSSLGVELSVHEPARGPSGNLQAWARRERYAAAFALAGGLGAGVATGHTASDQAETILYRLAASPGRRALLGMQPRRGRLLRPLLSVTRPQTAAYCEELGLPFARDATNDSLVHARNRVRHRVLPALREIHPAAEANVVRTARLLRDEADVLADVVRDARAALGTPARLEDLRALAPALARLVLQDMADEALGAAGAPAVGGRLDDVLALGAAGGSATLDLGRGLRARVAYGRLELRGEDDALTTAVPRRLEVPGELDFGGGRLRAERGVFPISDGSLGGGALRAGLEVRCWRPGDRMRPLGLGGTKTLQDLFTDAKVARRARRSLPVVVCGGEVAWIPGVATGEAFRVDAPGTEHVRLSWAPPA